MSHEDSVLIVDDDDGMCKLMARYLMIAGLRSEQAGSRGDAMERLERPGVSLVVIDLSLGKDSGTKLLDSIRGSHPDMPVVFCSAYPNMGQDYPDVPFVYKGPDFNPEDDKDTRFRREFVTTVKREIRNRCRDVQLAETRALGGQTHALASDIHKLLTDPETGLTATRRIAETALRRDLGDLAADQAAKPLVKWLAGALVVVCGSLFAMQASNAAAEERANALARERIEKIARKVNIE